MAVIEEYRNDVAAILARRYDNGADHWATPDRRLAKGGPFSTLGAARLLVELGEDPAGPALSATAELIWVSRAPLGPCHYGIGTLFMQVSYPLADYNLFSWVQVLSHYERARSDPRYLEALTCLDAKLVNGEVVPERVNKAMAGLEFCRKGAPSTLATHRYLEMRTRLA